MKNNLGLYVQTLIEYVIIIFILYFIASLFPEIEVSGAVSGAALMIALFSYNIMINRAIKSIKKGKKDVKAK
jgi:hypothetical protein